MAKRLCRIMTGIADAQAWANKLLQRESRGPGDMENALRRLEARYGVSKPATACPGARSGSFGIGHPPMCLSASICP